MFLIALIGFPMMFLISMHASDEKAALTAKPHTWKGEMLYPPGQAPWELKTTQVQKPSPTQQPQ